MTTTNMQAAGQAARNAIVIALCSLLPSGAQAEVRAGLRHYDETTQVFVAAIEGEITSNDPGAFERAIESSPTPEMIIVVLNSLGGDLSVAMEIGHLVRNMKLDVVIPKNAKCYSACVFILAAGIDKTVQGEVGIHRPYFGLGADSNSTTAAIKATKFEVETYLAEMNIPTQLAEDMFSIDPASMRVLSEVDLRDYRLNSMDYAEREALSVASAEKYGPTRQAYEAFRADLNTSCQFVVADPQAFRACAAEVATRNGVSLPSGWLD